MAITCTVSSSLINFTSSAGVRESLHTYYAAANAVSAGVITGSGTSGDPYVITGNREVRFTGANTLIDWSVDVHTKWNSITTSGTYALRFYADCDAQLGGGCTFDVSGSSATQIYMYILGKVVIAGDSGNPTVFKGFSRIYQYGRLEQSWDNFEIKNNRSSGGYNMYFSQYNSPVAPQMSFTNFKMYNDSGNNGYGLYFSPGGMYANVYIDGINIDGLEYGVLVYGCSAKIGGTISSEIKNCVNAGIYFQGAGNVVSAAYETSQDDTAFPTGKFQSMGVAQNITFTDNDLGASSILAYYNALVQVRDCTFVGDTYSGTQKATYSNYDSVVIHYNNTYTNCSANPNVWGANGRHLHGRKFDIIVKDEHDNEITDYTFSAIECSTPSHERWSAVQTGPLQNVFGGSPMFIQKEETSTGVFVNWCGIDVMCYKKGYEVFEEPFDLDQDYDITVNLLPRGKRCTLPIAF